MTEYGEEREKRAYRDSQASVLGNEVFFSWGEDERWRNWFSRKDDFNFECVDFEISVGCAW